MKKLNNKGFAVSTILYGALSLIILILILILSIMKSTKDMNEGLVEGLVDSMNKCASLEAELENCYYNKQGNCLNEKVGYEDCIANGGVSTKKEPTVTFTLGDEYSSNASCTAQKTLKGHLIIDEWDHYEYEYQYAIGNNYGNWNEVNSSEIVFDIPLSDTNDGYEGSNHSVAVYVKESDVYGNKYGPYEDTVYYNSTYNEVSNEYLSYDCGGPTPQFDGSDYYCKVSEYIDAPNGYFCDEGEGITIVWNLSFCGRRAMSYFAPCPD